MLPGLHQEGHTLSSENESASTPPTAVSGCKYAHARSVACLTMDPSLSDVKWDHIEALGNSVEQRIRDDKPKKVVFDITGLTYMGSAMVALVVRWWKAVDEIGGKSAVALHDPNVLEVLKLASLDEHWTIVPTREAAYNKLGATPVPEASEDVSSTSVRTAAPADDEPGRGQWLMIIAAMVTAAAVMNMIVGNKPDNFDTKFMAGAVTAIAGLLALILAGPMCGARTRTATRILGFVTLLAGGIAVAMVKIPLVGPDSVVPGPAAEETADENKEDSPKEPAESSSEPAASDDE